MTSSAIGRRGMYVNCKHLYYVFRFLLQARLQSGRFHPCPHSKHGQSPADSGSRRDNQDSLVLDAMFCRGLETLNRRLVNGLLMLFCSLGGE
jgi:hypothetical protein